MTVREFVELMINPGSFEIEIFKYEGQETIFKGKAEDLPDDILDAEIASVDSPGHYFLCVNID